MPSSKRPLNTGGLIRSKDEIDQDTSTTTAVADSRDMSPADERLKRASFDLRESQVRELGMLKYRTGRKISELVQEAIDDLLRKYP